MRELMIVTYETGCRPQESLRVEARHVDVTNQRWVFPQSEAKMQKAPRIVYLTPQAFEITCRLVARYPEGPLFRNSNGRPWTTEAVNCGFQRIKQRVGTEEVELSRTNVDQRRLDCRLDGSCLFE